MEIAVVGMGAVLPGCDSLEDFWQSVLDSKDLKSEVPPGRWKKNPRKFIAEADTKDRVLHNQGYFCQEIPHVPPGLMMSQEQWSELDPVFHMALKAGRDAFYDGKWGSVDREKMGVILGNIALPTEGSASFVCQFFDASLSEKLGLSLGDSEERSPYNYFSTSLPAKVLASSLGLGMESFTLDAACASSLYAIKYACDRLESGEADAMLAGGICRADSLFTQMGFTQLKALSPSGVCRPFDSQGDGLMVGEGGAVFFLKRLADARDHGDRIYGVIRGAGLSNDMTGKLMAPNSKEQLRAMRGAFEQSQWAARDVDFIECHATGTPLGDRVELATLKALLGERESPCVISSIKANIGHLLTGAGATGLLRLLLAMKYETFPPTCNYKNLPDDMEGDLPFEILKTAKPWQKSEGVSRKAGLSGFGFGGINAHLHIEEYIPQVDRPVAFVKSYEMRPVAIVGIHRQIPDSQASGQASGFGFPQQAWFQQKGLVGDRRSFHQLLVPFGLLKIPPNEIQSMLPQQIEALLSAKKLSQRLTDFDRVLMGVYVGLEKDGLSNCFRARWQREDLIEDILSQVQLNLSQDDKESLSEQLKDNTFQDLTADGVMGSLGSITASRIAKELRSGGPAITVSNMENSGMSALKLAVQAIQRQELKTALVSAVDMAGGVLCHLATQALWAREDIFKDSSFVDGAVTLLLQDAELAKSNGAKIYGLIDGISGSIDEEESYLPPRSILALAQKKGHGNVSFQSLQGGKGHPVSPRLLGGWQDVATVQEDLEYYGAATGLMRFAESLEISCRTNTLAGKPFLFGFQGSNRSSFWLLAEPKLQSLGEELKKHLAPQTDKGVLIESLEQEGDVSFIIPLLGQPERQGGYTEPNHEKEDSHPMDHVPYESSPEPRNGDFWNHLMEQMLLTEKSKQIAQKSFADAAQKVMTYSMKIAEDLSERRGAQTLGLFLPTWTPELSEKNDEELAKYIPMNPEKPLLDYEACMEFAAGAIGEVFGDDFAHIDEHPTRVRLPTDRLLLCHRVMSMRGEKKSLKAGRLVTEHDINSDSWYLDQGRIPTAIAIEAGQADLLLSAWLGADDHTKGLAMYRLLDAEVTFYDVLPSSGQYIRYEIHIDHFFRRGNTLLFRFGFDAFVGKKPLLSMKDGCAGFFTEKELHQGKGIIKDENLDLKGKYTGDYQPRFVCEKESYGSSELDFLRAGQLVKCFGQDFSQLRVKNPATIPGGDLSLVHRISCLDTYGGRYGLGLVIGEADIKPDDWFLTCHFIDDQVMPGTLMYECCLHTLRVFLLRHGWVGDVHKVSFDPIPEQASRLKCRGQVLASTKQVRYEIHVKEMGYGPQAYVLADAYMYSDEKCIVDIKDMSIQVTGFTRESMDETWKDARQEPLFSHKAIQDFTSGDPSKAFGKPYEPFDLNRRMARLPRGRLQLVSKILSCTAEAFKLAEKTKAVGVYENKPTSWYYQADPSNSIPFSILLEIALQPCGWLAAYMGSALSSDDDLFFRNLQGHGRYLRTLNRHSGELRIDVTTLKIAQSAGMMIQEYAFIVSDAMGAIYEGESAFGFFTEKALSQQQGLKADSSSGVLEKRDPRDIPKLEVFPEPPLMMLDQVEELDWEAGKYGLGRAMAYKAVRSDDWFFHDHFYQDPVMPGSLGLEAMVQLGKFVASEKWAGHVFSLKAPSEHKWIYRGQVLPENKFVTIDLHIKDMAEQERTIIFDAFLYCDDLLIYKLEGFCIAAEVLK